MKFCKDCKYCMVSDTGIAFAKCGKTTATGPDPVTGEQVSESKYCSTMRMSASDTCGTDGRWFEPKLKVVA